MNVAIYSREAIENLMQEDFPNNVAVISFYDPPTKRNAKFYTPPVDYSGKTDRVFQTALNDLDPSALEDVGLTVDTFFTEADDLAVFIYAAKADGLDIICQCEYGQSRSAGCAAAILEHFSKTGISIFTDYRYYPNQLVFHKVFDALKMHKIMSVSPYYYCSSEEYIKKQLSQFEGGDGLMFSLDNKKNCIRAKEQIESFLTGKNQLCRTWWDAIDRFIGKVPAQYISARFSADFWDMDYFRGRAMISMAAEEKLRAILINLQDNDQCRDLKEPIIIGKTAWGSKLTTLGKELSPDAFHLSELIPVRRCDPADYLDGVWEYRVGKDILRLELEVNDGEGIEIKLNGETVYWSWNSVCDWVYDLPEYDDDAEDLFLLIMQHGGALDPEWADRFVDDETLEKLKKRSVPCSKNTLKRFDV